MNNVYFRNLDGLRLIAASLVIIHHVELLTYSKGLSPERPHLFFITIGKFAVILFFVLSGFLITYLLLDEKQNLNKIEIYKFYTRRVLRIWPLYFLILLLAFFIFPNIDFFNFSDQSKTLNKYFYECLILYVFFMPNFALAIYGSVPYASLSWSIGVEEQFYLIWPILIAKSKKPIISIIFFIIILYGFKFLYFYPEPKENTLTSLIFHTPIHCIAIGSVAGYLKFTDRFYPKNMLKNIYFQLLFIIITISCLLADKIIPFAFKFEVFALLSVFIVTICAESRNLYFLETRLIKFLGKTSYGIYMIHPILLTICLKTLLYYEFYSKILFYFLTFTTTFCVSSIVYIYFERPFLKIKEDKFTAINGNQIAYDTNK